MPEPQTRGLVAKALAPKGKNKTITPFEMKGARQGRVFAEALVKAGGVPPAYRAAFKELETCVDPRRLPAPRPRDHPQRRRPCRHP